MHQRPSTFLIAYVAITLAYIVGLFFPLSKENILRVPTSPPPSLFNLRETLPPYVRDNIGLRVPLAGFGNIVSMLVLGRTQDPRVYLGSGGWLFFGPMNAPRLLNRDQLEDWVTYLKGRNAWFAQRGIRYVFLSVPEKFSIYPERAPVQLQTIPSAIGQLQRALSGSSVTIIDPTNALLDEKDDHLLYFPRDTHWTSIAGFMTQQVIQTTLENEGLFPITAEGVRSTTIDESSDLVRMLGLPTFFLSNDIPRYVPAHAYAHNIFRELDAHDESIRLVVATDDPARPNVLVYHDSFIAGLEPFLAESAGTTTLLRQFGFTRMEKEEIEAAKPDIVIEEMSQRIFLEPDFRPSIELWMALGVP